MSEQHPVLSKVPTSLSGFRLAYGALQTGNILKSSPQERTWMEAAKTAGVALTDKMDGIWSRQFGSTKNGPIIDRLADMTFSVGGELALAFNGEISPVHPILSIGRETTVNTLRMMAETKGRAIPVGSRGRQKTTLKMAMIMAARSPISRQSDTIESMASLGTALSIISGFEYAQEYISENVERRTSSARNGNFRKASDSPNEKVVRWIDKKFPNIVPDHLTVAGESLVEAALIATLLRPKWGAAMAIGPYTLGGLIDGWDGNLARLKGLNSLEGMIRDVRADKRQEIFTALTNSLLASRRSNNVAASQYAVAAMTASLPALFRAAAESKGYIVNEDASGSRVIRGIEGGVGIGLNSQPGIGDTISALMLTGNIITAAQRVHVVRHGESSPHYRGTNSSAQFRSEAAARRDALLPIALGGMAVGSGLLIKLSVGSAAEKSLYNY
jgi:phosphatidylglycerophosphate synthase